MPGSSHVRGGGNRGSKPHFAIQKQTGVNPNSQRGSAYHIWEHWLHSSRAHCLYRNLVVKIQQNSDVFHTFLTLKGLNPHLLHLIIFSYPCFLLTLCWSSDKSGRFMGLRRAGNESKRDSSIAIPIALSTTRWSTKGLSTCSKRMACFYTDLLMKIHTISCSTRQANIDHLFLFAFHKLFIAFRDSTLCLCLWERSLQLLLVKLHYSSLN